MPCCDRPIKLGRFGRGVNPKSVPSTPRAPMPFGDWSERSVRSAVEALPSAPWKMGNSLHRETAERCRWQSYARTAVANQSCLCLFSVLPSSLSPVQCGWPWRNDEFRDRALRPLSPLPSPIQFRTSSRTAQRAETGIGPRFRNRGPMSGTRLELVTSTMSTWRSNQLS